MHLKRDLLEKVAIVATLFILFFAWLLGGLRQDSSVQKTLSQATPSGLVYTAMGQNLWQARARDSNLDANNPTTWLSLATAVGYGGPLEIVTAIDNVGELTGIAITASAETESYLNQVIDSGFVDDFLNKKAQSLPLILPIVDGTSGATLTSKAIHQAILISSQHSARDGLQQTIPPISTSALSMPNWMDGLALVLFIAAIVINQAGFKWKVASRRIIMGVSLIMLGFYAAAPFGLGTVGYLLNGFWVDGVASYTSLMLLLFTVGYLLFSNKNIYCNTVCPFGAAQECIGKLNKAKACKSNHPLMLWFPRILVTFTLALGLYFRSPSSFSFEPFGMAFNMIGGPILFALTILVILTSLFIHKPWCQTLCPITQTMAFLRAMKLWGKSLTKKKRSVRPTKQQEKPHAR
ncbi:4Fe-4S binding protein [Photobacterium sp. Alg240-V54]|uniref:FMN-binding protein n=1 Tax=Photobacterium sp. Alg240-V54 TaxID=2305995 RepID=UPI0013D1D4D6|nr:4Fe-4S binding protein [Photobacterium sp. Alg240-V54]